MPIYSYNCPSCKRPFEVDKSMDAPAPEACPLCGAMGPQRDYREDAPSVTYANRPPWTYNDCLKYKDCKFNDSPRTRIDPRKHGDIGAWNSPGNVIPVQEKPRKKRPR